MAFTNHLLINSVLFCLLSLTLQNNYVRGENVKKPEIYIDTPAVVTVFKGQSIELPCFVSMSSDIDLTATNLNWTLPVVEEYMEEDRKKRIVYEQYDFGDTDFVKILKLRIPSIRYQDRGEYDCVGRYNVTGYNDVTGKILVVVEEHTGFAPAVWILIGFLLMTCISVGIIIVWEWRGIAMGKKEEGAPINTVQF